MVGAYILAKHGVRPWYEHVPSDSNPADPLSRDGFLDPWVSGKIQEGEWVRHSSDPDGCLLVD